MGRRPCCSKEGLNRGAWMAEEDEILIAHIRSHGEGRWRSLPKNAGLKRCGKSCRLRWLNYLRPDIKRGNISEQEEDLIINSTSCLETGRLPGRTDNEIKNYWNTTLSRKLHGRPVGRPKPNWPTAEGKRIWETTAPGDKLPVRASPQPPIPPQEPADVVKLDVAPSNNDDEQALRPATVVKSSASSGETISLGLGDASDNLMTGLDLIEEMFTVCSPHSSLFLVTGDGTGEGARNATAGGVAAGDEGNRDWSTWNNSDDGTNLLDRAVVADWLETDSSQAQHSPSDFQFVASFLNLEEWL